MSMSLTTSLGAGLPCLSFHGNSHLGGHLPLRQHVPLPSSFSCQSLASFQTQGLCTCIPPLWFCILAFPESAGDAGWSQIHADPEAMQPQVRESQKKGLEILHQVHPSPSPSQSGVHVLLHMASRCRHRPGSGQTGPWSPEQLKPGMG